MRFGYSILFFSLLNLLALNAAATPDNQSEKIKLPTLSGGPGVMIYRGDVGQDRLSESILSHAGFQLEVQFLTTGKVSLSAFYLSGKASANNYDYTRPLNFESSIFAQGLQARYDFTNSSKPDAIITPFITSGVEFMQFNSFTDLLDKDGNTYHYWNDGTIRSMDQYSTNSQFASILYRDYVYETNIRDANLDGFGKYRQNCIAFPFGAGVRMRLSDRSSIHFSVTYHAVESDFIDGITNESTGERRGDSKNDHLIFTAAMFRYAFGAPRSSDKGEYSHVDFKKLEKEDADNDGIPDVKDAINEQDAKKVDATGRPVDSDKDGIPDYRDKEAGTPSGNVVNEDGITVTQKMIEDKFRQDSLAALPAIVEYLQSFDRLNTGTRGSTISKSALTEIPVSFKDIDINRDGFISPPEIGKATEDFISGKSNFDSRDFYKLIEFYFKQYQ